ncbi:hypothetical protein EVAR_22787_1 [Eumeta japonica]|uniref:Uncharacterized protein n=1 Tax=Eumeta variegata TaxID=151549 RepID=A0A4C1VG99_EUMVA|nr:hypothetical protein EVAR_22787_1 [Eumeta japonica]
MAGDARATRPRGGSRLRHYVRYRPCKSSMGIRVVCIFKISLPSTRNTPRPFIKSVLRTVEEDGRAGSEVSGIAPAVSAPPPPATEHRRVPGGQAAREFMVCDDRRRADRPPKISRRRVTRLMRISTLINHTVEVYYSRYRGVRTCCETTVTSILENVNTTRNVATCGLVWRSNRYYLNYNVCIKEYHAPDSFKCDRF